ncbi:hypothetical protein FSP39_012152 [Pinctada imbricata]|uniref:Arginyl-tRNA--protein transferase 1 n=1 Tax=Pinctada imbricata TaxID=66713 RepID=A0AA88Y8W3_PINIB|nr:hypothetical protein FSP39_012152 [Pinctada imbricata]
MDESPGIVEWFGGGDSGHRCGYCGQSSTNMSDGMWAHSLTVQNYQNLIDRGWRRSGKYCYKPNMKKMCCPHYTIKCEALNFQMSKSHKKIIKLFNKYIIHGVKRGEGGVKDGEGGVKDGESGVKDGESGVKDGEGRVMGGKGGVMDVEGGVKDEEKDEEASMKEEEEASGGRTAADSGVVSKEGEQSTVSMESQSTSKTPRPGDGPDPTKPKCKKAKEIRMERKKAKMEQTNLESAKRDEKSSPKEDKKKVSTEKTLEDFLNEYKSAENCAHKFEIRLVRSSPRSQEFQESFKDAHKVYHSYQMQIHKDPPDKPSVKQYTRFLVDSPLQIRLVRANPRSDDFKKTFNESYKVFKAYQMSIHKEKEWDCGKSSYEEFLVEGPLQELHKDGGLPMGYGSFHQQYIIDGKIIAVGVIDILPHCTSSVYLYYDPDYHFLSLGTYTALQEIAFTRYLNSLDPELKYYYMGYYIHSCPKMKYKGQYHPSFLLCPEVYSWEPIKECAPKLDKNKYSRFAAEGKKDADGDFDINDVGILFMRQAMNYQLYRAFNKNANDAETVKKYATFVGKNCAQSMLLFRS